MKTTTTRGTKVEIVGTCPLNMLMVNVHGRNDRAQVNAFDLIKPSGDLPIELADYKFYDEEEATKLWGKKPTVPSEDDEEDKPASDKDATKVDDEGKETK